MRGRILLGSALAVLAIGMLACAGHSPGVATVSAPPRVDPDAVYVGTWAYDVSIGNRMYKGTLDLSRATTGWNAKLNDDQGELFTVRSVAIAGDSVRIVVAGSEGEPATVAATRQSDGTLAGKVTIREGEGTFLAKKK